jgi:tetratricopeptide (TPR) repeat protein
MSPITIAALLITTGGDYDRAIADLDQAIRLDPQYAIAYFNRGTAYGAKGEFDHAIADYDEYLRIDPSYQRGYALRGEAYYGKGDYLRAIADYDEAIRLNPKYVAAYGGRGAAYVERGEYDRAIADLDQAIRLDPKFANPYSNRCSALRHKGDHEHAMLDCDQAIRLNPKYARAYVNRGDVHAARGDDKRAIADYEEALRINPKLTKAAAAKREALLRLPPKPAAVTAAPSATAGLAPKMGRRVALVIGNGSYRSVGRLPNPTRDATAVAAQLKLLGFEVIERYDQDMKAMRSALREFEGTLAGADWALVYYAGHGMELDGRNWLIPVDANLERATDVPDEAIELERVREAKRLRIVILDACRNNPYLSRMVMAGGRSRAVARGLADIEPEHGEVVFYAARHGTTAEDGRSEHSPFTISLLRYLGEEGLELGLFFRKVTSDVLASTTPKQQPFVYGSIPADNFYFLPPKSTP